MKGGFNKLLRNIVASSTDTEFEKVSDRCKMTPMAIEASQGHFPHGQQGAQGKARYL